ELIITEGQQGLRRIRRLFLRVIQSTFRCVASIRINVVAYKVEKGVQARKSRSSERKIGVKLHRLIVKTGGFQHEIEKGAACFKSQAAQIRIVSLKIVCRFNCQRLLLATGELCLQRLRYSFGDLTLNLKDVSQLPIVGFCPKVGIGLGVNQLYIDPHLLGRFLDTTLKNVRHAKLLGDLAEIARLARIALRGTARNDF